MSEEKWIKTLTNSKLRLGNSSKSTDDDIRSEFQKDFDRIVFSSPFRRLQNKTQVLPLPKSDYVRNRLTHSLETSSVGRSLGNIVGKTLLTKYPAIKEKLKLSSFDFGYMVSAACLAHDIGNPPFGHAGEDAINHFFKSKEAEKFTFDLDIKEIADLQNFEGNSAGFRLLATSLKSQNKIEGGLRLTFGTLATFVKYPKESLPNRKHEGKASLKKYGLFQTEVETYSNIAISLKLIAQNNKREDYAWKRFPLAFLVEASDDICYHIIDLEDGFNVGLIGFDEIYDFYTAILDKCNNDGYKRKLQNVVDNRSRITYLRSLVINSLIFKATDIFVNNEDSILSGVFDEPLLKRLDKDLIDILDKIKKKSIEKIYNSKSILKIEAAGYQVVPFLLDAFIKAQLTEENYEGKKQIYGLLPNQYKIGENKYEKILNVVMFISGMTDRYAVELYKNLKGIQLADY
ncbi:MAG: dNTP triphosphohydrolase [Bacteroidales bacterium]|nr:dNTP triphosphohydrolase [Bacteroidales bacterium]